MSQYEFYNVFPWSFAIHIFILVVGLLFAFEQNENCQQVFMPQIKAFYLKFLFDGDQANL